MSTHARISGGLTFLIASLATLPAALAQVALTPAQIAKRVSPSVVMIQGRSDSAQIVGSGFIVSRTGDVITNLHVIRDLETATVHLTDGRVFNSVSVMGINEPADLAVIRITGSGFPSLAMGDEGAPSVGDRVVALGSPLGLDGTVTAGIISAIRKVDGDKYLQTDAAVNPGNSGGPLVNVRGEAIGVVSFKMRSAEALNFAISISVARTLLAFSQKNQPMSFDQMRSLLSTPKKPDASVQGEPSTPQPAQVEGGPSLNETLNWIAGKLPLGTINIEDVDPQYGPVEHSVTMLPGNFESCTITVDEQESERYTKFPHTRIRRENVDFRSEVV